MNTSIHFTWRTVSIIFEIKNWVQKKTSNSYVFDFQWAPVIRPNGFKHVSSLLRCLNFACLFVVKVRRPSQNQTLMIFPKKWPQDWNSLTFQYFLHFFCNSFLNDPISQNLCYYFYLTSFKMTFLRHDLKVTKCFIIKKAVTKSQQWCFW